jgi:crossover junction endodeoxyribonuclease RuvC
MVIVGIDPGISNTGYGVLRVQQGRLSALDGGVIQSSPQLALERRLDQIYTRIVELIDCYRAQVMALEDLYFGKNVRTALAVGQARGVVLLAAGKQALPCVSYTPQQIKSAVCGSGRANKDQVQRMVMSLLKLPTLPKPDHAADALAVGICHANMAPLQAALAAQ